MSDETEVAEPEMDAATAERVSAENMRLLENIDVALTVEVGKAEIKIRDLLRLNEGSVRAGPSGWRCVRYPGQWDDDCQG